MTVSCLTAIFLNTINVIEAWPQCFLLLIMLEGVLNETVLLIEFPVKFPLILYPVQCVRSRGMQHRDLLIGMQPKTHLFSKALYLRACFVNLLL